MTSDWTEKPLRDVVIFENRRRIPLSAAERSKRRGPYPYWGANGPFDTVDDYLFEGPRVLIAEDGNTVVRADGRGTVHWANGRYWVNNHAHVLSVGPDYDLRWLYYALCTAYVRDFVSGSAQPKLSMGSLKQLPLRVPPLDEQSRIASVLGSIDDKIESNRRLGQLAEEAMAHCCTRIASIDPAPAPGWSAVPFLEALEINPRVPIAKGTDAPFIAMADVPAFGTRPDTIGRRPYSGGCKYEPGDTLMARITGCIEHGKGAFIDFVEEPGAGSTEFLVFRARDPLTPEIVFCLSRDQRLRSHAIASMTGTSGRQRVDNACFEALTVSIAPDSKERAAAMAFMRRAMQISKAAWAEARTLSSLRDGLLPKLVSGRIHIPIDPDETVAIESATADLVESPA